MHVKNTFSKIQFIVIPQILSYLFLNQLKLRLNQKIQFGIYESNRTFIYLFI